MAGNLSHVPRAGGGGVSGPCSPSAVSRAEWGCPGRLRRLPLRGWEVWVGEEGPPRALAADQPARPDPSPGDSASTVSRAESVLGGFQVVASKTDVTGVGRLRLSLLPAPSPSPRARVPVTG